MVPTTIALLLSGLGQVAGNAADSNCSSDSRIHQSEITDGLVMCDGVQSKIILDDGRTFDLPEAGTSVSSSSLSISGYSQSDVTLALTPSNAVQLTVGSEVIVGEPGQKSTTSLLSSAGIAYVASDPVCSDYSYSFMGYHWPSDHTWRYNGTSQVGTGPLTAIREANDVWVNGSRRCATTLFSSSYSASFLNYTSINTDIYSSGGCASSDGVNAVGWGL